MTVHSKDGPTWSIKLERIKLLSSRNQDIKFNNVGHIIDLEMLKEHYMELSSKKAIGIDGVTKATYGKHLETNLNTLLKSIRLGQYRPKAARTTRIPITEKLKGLRTYLRTQLNKQNKTQILYQIVKVVKGWINYHGISDNQRRVGAFIHQSKYIIHRWFNRMGNKRAMTWQRLRDILKKVNFPENWKTVSMFAK